MRASLVAGAGLVAAVSASYNGTTPVYTTEVVTAYTTYCPEPTSIVHNNMTYTITEVRRGCATEAWIPSTRRLTPFVARRRPSQLRTAPAR